MDFKKTHTSFDDTQNYFVLIWQGWSRELVLEKNAIEIQHIYTPIHGKSKQ